MSAGVYRTDNMANKEMREDLVDEITMITPIDTPLFSNLPEGDDATNATHEWLNDEISRSSGINASVEGADAAFSDLSGPSRDSNYVQEIDKTFKVSWKSRKVDTAGMNDTYAYHEAKAMKQWKLDAEFSLIYGSGIEGNSGVAAVMKGLFKAITTNYVSYASGTSLTEERFNDIMELAYDNVEDSDFDAYVPIGLKRAISGFTSTVERSMDADEARLIRKVDIYEGDVFNTVRIYKHRDLNSSNGTADSMILLQPKYFKKSFLDTARPNSYELAKTGANTKGMIWGGMTLEFSNEKAGIVAHNLVK